MVHPNLALIQTSSLGLKFVHSYRSDVILILNCESYSCGCLLIVLADIQWWECLHLWDNRWVGKSWTNFSLGCTPEGRGYFIKSAIVWAQILPGSVFFLLLSCARYFALRAPHSNQERQGNGKQYKSTLILLYFPIIVTTLLKNSQRISCSELK